MRRDSHDCAGSIVRQHVISDEESDPPSVERVDGMDSSDLDSGLLLVEVGPLHIGLLLRLGDVGLYLGGILGSAFEALHEGVVRGEHREGHSEDRIDPGREDFEEVVAPVYGHFELRSLGPSDPILLHLDDGWLPVEAIEVIEHSLGVFRDPEYPLPHRPALDLRLAAFASAVLQVFSGKARLAARAPVDRLVVDVGEPMVVDISPPLLCGHPVGDGKLLDRYGFSQGIVVGVSVQLQEDPLGPSVVPGVGRVDLTFPIVGESDVLKLFLVALDILGGGDFRVDLIGDRIILGRQSECVPSHRMEHVISFEHLLARDHIGGDEPFRVSHMESFSARIREHIEYIEFRLVSGLDCPVDLLLFPFGSPFGLDLRRVVLFHRWIGAKK